MKIKNSAYTSPFNRSTEFVKLQGKEWQEKQRVAGKICAGAISLLLDEVKSGTSKTMIELDKLAHEYILDNKAIPTFYQYKGFPNAVCISVNRTLVHGIPKNYVLKEEDIVSFDLGATVEGGVIADTATTTIFGEANNPLHEKLVETTKLCLKKAIESIRIGNRVGSIGEVVYKTAKNEGFSVVDKFGGHGLEYDRPHSTPFISNRSSGDIGIRIQPGLTIAIEPLLVIGNSNITATSDDGWSVYCENLCAHEEHTIYVDEDGVIEVMTQR